MRAVGAATRQHNRHPDRPPRIRTINFPLRPPRLRDDPVGDDGLYLLEQAHPDRPASHAVRGPRCRIRLGLPSHPASPRRSCLRLGVSITSSSRGLPSPSDRPCRAYSRRRRSAAPVARLLRRALPWVRLAQAGSHPHVHAGSKLLTASRGPSHPCQPGMPVAARWLRPGPAPASSSSSRHALLQPVRPQVSPHVRLSSRDREC